MLPGTRTWSALQLKTRLQLYYLLVSILPTLFVGLVAYQISLNVTKEMALQSSVELMDRASGEMNKLVDDADSVAKLVSGDPHIQELLRQDANGDIRALYSMELELDTKLNALSVFSQDFLGIYIVGENGMKSKSNFYSTKKEDLRQTEWYRKIVQSRQILWFGKTTGSLAVETADQTTIAMGFPIIDLATGAVLGVGLVDIDETTLSEMIQANLSKQGFLVMMDRDRRIVASPDKLDRTLVPNTWDASKFEKGDKHTYIRDSGQFLLMYKELQIDDWIIAGVIPKRELTKASAKIGYVIVAALVCISVLALIASWKISNSVANPIRRMMMLMRRVEEGDLSVVMKVDREDEVGMLGRSFNVMIVKIKQLMERIYEEQQEMRKSELKALQAQINPHFLYNTLESIIWLARSKRTDDAVNMVTALTKQFRIALSKGRDIITIGEELEHIENYLTVQQMRYRSRFDYVIRVPESLLSYRTIKLILQPIVENAIYHGVKLKREKGLIEITGEDRGGDIVLAVRDTGRGMDEDTLTALNNTLAGKTENTLESYGVRNVHERLQIYFGPEYGLSYFSELGAGTTAVIRIPKQREEGGADAQSRVG